MSELKTTVAVMSTDIKHIKNRVDHIDDKLNKKYVTKAEFIPFKNILYGIVGFVVITVGGYVLNTFFNINK
jgi:hypothetical protein